MLIEVNSNHYLLCNHFFQEIRSILNTAEALYAFIYKRQQWFLK